MSLFNDKIIHEIFRIVLQHQQMLSRALGSSEHSEQALYDLLPHSPLYADLTLLIRIANGEVSRTQATKSDLQHVENTLLRIQEMLVGNALHLPVKFSDSFWKTDPGILLSRVRWWLSVDDLITISNAAALAFGENTQANRMRIVRAIDNGYLDCIPDPSIVNPQQNKRVLRPQVERLRDQRTLPE